FYYTSPNARKVVMALEETGLEYSIRWVDIGSGDQHTPEYRRINPNGRIPAIVDRDGPGGEPITLFESGAILHYLAEKTGKLLPSDPAERWRAICWVHWQVANQGPMLGQASHFVSHVKSRGISDSYARDRFVREADRLYRVLDEGLGEREFLAGEFSIADIACFPWVRVAKGQGIEVADYPAVEAWSGRVSARPSATVKIPDQRDEATKSYKYTDEQWEILFGSTRSEK
ncbi:MAG: glutathione S-transferase family protein, partial [Rubrobacteraceae bacterium]